MNARHRWSIAMLIGVCSQLAVADEAADRKAIEAVSQQWVEAYNARDSAALMRLVTDDVVLLDPALPPASGRRDAHEAWLKALERNQGALAMKSKEIEIANDFAWRVATLSQGKTNSIGKPTQTLEIWQRVDGQWKLHRQMSSGLLAPSRILRSPPEGPMNNSRPN